MSSNYGQMFTPSGEQFKWNSHSLGAFDTCARYYLYSVIEGWEYPDPSVHLVFGGHYADSLQEYYLCVAGGATREEAIRQTIRSAMVKTWDQETGLPWETDHAKDRFTLIRTLVWYFEEFSDDLPVMTFNGEPGVEVKFAFDLNDGNVLVGMLDRVVTYMGTPWIMDQKTTGTTLTPKFFLQFDPHMQVSQYTFAGKAILDAPIQGVIIDGVQIAVGFSRYARSPIYRTDSQLNEWYDSAMLLIERAQHAVREQQFPMSPSACGNYGGCQFREICSRSPEVRRNFLAARFVKKPKAVIA
jgi:hypothetical protein